MRSRLLDRLVVEPGTAGAEAVASALSEVMAGDRPAFCPVPDGPSPYVDRITNAVRPDDTAAPLEYDDIAVCMVTSGSAGDPRGVLLTAEALAAAAVASDRRLGGPAHWLLALPVHHIGGLGVLVRSRASGTPPTVLASIGGAGRFVPERFVEVARAARTRADDAGLPARTAIVPTQLGRILDHGKVGIDALRLFDAVLVGGAATPTAMTQRARANAINIVSAYGMTETSGGCVYDGRALPGVAVSVTEADEHDVGRIEVSGPVVARAYRLRPAATAESFSPGRFSSADAGRIVGGKLQLIGRVDDVVQVGGVNVSLAAVDDCVLGCPGVEQAAAVAVPDEQWGCRITVFVASRMEDVPGAAQQAGEFERRVSEEIRSHLGSGARPRRVVILPEMPILPSGKVDRQILEQWAASDLPGADPTPAK